MMQMRATILGIDNLAALISVTLPGYINALFAGVLLETVFLASAHMHLSHHTAKMNVYILIVDNNYTEIILYDLYIGRGCPV